jgi:DNA-binding PadR family transcriptional regulator
MSSEDGPHPLEGLVLHLLPGRIPGLTQRELLKKIERNLSGWPDLTMQEVRPVVLSAVLANLERRGLIESNGEGTQRCYWRCGPLPLPSPGSQQCEVPGSGDHPG